MSIVKKPLLLQVIAILILGIISVSMAAIFIRLSLEAVLVKTVGFSLFLAASRLLIATTFLLPNWMSIQLTSISSSAYRYSIMAGVALALHFASWITSLSFTSIAASTVLVTTNPLWISLFSWLWLGEKLTRLTLLGMLISLSGGVAIALSDIDNNAPQASPLLGNILALAGAILVSLYLLFGREAQRQGLGIKNYITIAYSMAALLLFPFPFFFNSSYVGYPLIVYFYVFLMAIISQLVGHTSLNWTLRWLSPTVVTIVILFEPIIASILAWVFFQEIPSKGVIFGGVILLLGVALSVMGSSQDNHNLYPSED